MQQKILLLSCNTTYLKFTFQNKQKILTFPKFQANLPDTGE